MGSANEAWVDMDRLHGSRSGAARRGRPPAVIATGNDGEVGDVAVVSTMCSAMERIQEACAVMAYPRLARVARAVLGALERMQAREVAPTPAMLADVLAAVNTIDRRLRSRGDREDSATSNDEQMIAQLARWRGTVEWRTSDSGTPPCGADEEMNTLLLDEIRERMSGLTLLAHYQILFAWKGDGPAGPGRGENGRRDN